MHAKACPKDEDPALLKSQQIGRFIRQFLRLNGIEPMPDGPKGEELTLGVAVGTLDRKEATGRLRKLIKKRN